jgi:hypothetical protein
MVGQSWECMWTASLADGQLTVEGPFFDTKGSSLATTGGTGNFRGARGEMKLQAPAPRAGYCSKSKAAVMSATAASRLLSALRSKRCSIRARMDVVS